MGLVLQIQLFFATLWKWLIALLTGKTELERICLSGRPQHTIVLQLERSFARSKKIPAHLAKLLQHVPVDADPEDVANQIVSAKGIRTDRPHYAKFREGLVSSLSLMRDLSRLHDKLEEKRSEAYDSDNAEHEERLTKLWDLLRPNVRLTARKCADWGEIGFQGHDPATDFRGMGMLGLLNMVSLASDFSKTAHAILYDTASHSNWFGFAITSIQITADVFQMLQRRQLNAYFYEFGCTEEAFVGLYASAYARFNAAWAKANPENVMAFLYIHNDFLKVLKEDAVRQRLQPLSRKNLLRTDH